MNTTDILSIIALIISLISFLIPIFGLRFIAYINGLRIQEIKSIKGTFERSRETTNSRSFFKKDKVFYNYSDRFEIEVGNNEHGGNKYDLIYIVIHKSEVEGIIYRRCFDLKDRSKYFWKLISGIIKK